ncbi:uncharacterized protein LOC110271023 [Arachis ipaensis]|nr:uncharacterized protein LOC110271023 [Arachis ipaensis]
MRSPGPLLTLGQSCYRKSMPSGRKDWKNQESHQHLEDSSSSMLGGIPQWGQVPCPAQFRINCKENLAGHVSSSKNKVATVAPPNIESPVAAFNFSSAESDTTKFDKMLIEEVQRLRAELKRLEEHCELKNHKIQECQQKIEESWFVAKEEATKSKAAKEVIKALAVRLHTISGKENAGQEGKVGIHDCMSNLAPIHIDMNSPRDGNMDIWHNTLLGTLENCRVLFACLVALLLNLYLFIYLFIVS